MSTFKQLQKLLSHDRKSRLVWPLSNIAIASANLKCYTISKDPGQFTGNNTHKEYGVKGHCKI